MPGCGCNNFVPKTKECLNCRKPIKLDDPKKIASEIAGLAWLECPVCLNLAHQPPKLECGHIACMDCITNGPLTQVVACHCGQFGSLMPELIAISGSLVKAQSARALEHGHGWALWRCPVCSRGITDESVVELDPRAMAVLSVIKHACRIPGCQETCVLGMDQLGLDKHEASCIHLHD